MTLTVGILVFDGVDELDFVGPLDVFAYAAMLSQNKGRIVTIGTRTGPLQGGNGLRFLTDHNIVDAPPLDVLIIPGGSGTDQLVDEQPVLDWIRETAAAATWLCSVCSGSFVLQAAGLVEGRRITTHSMGVERLRLANSGHPVENQRYVVDGNMVTSQGVSAGIDMSLWVVGQLYGEDHARTVRAYLDYNPEPPF